MPKRFTKKQRAMKYRHIRERDGEKCVDCGLGPHSNPPVKLAIDHVNNDKHDNRLANLEFRCTPCNTKKENQRRAQEIPQVPRGRKTFPEVVRVQELQNQVKYDEGSAEMQATERFKEPFYKYVLYRVSEEGSSDYKDCMNAGALAVVSNPNTTRKYLDMLTSSEGPLEVYTDPKTKKKRLRFRES